MRRLTVSTTVTALALTLGVAFAVPVAHADGTLTRYAPTLSNMERDDVIDWLDKVDRDLSSPKYRHVKDDDRARIGLASRDARKMLAGVQTLAGLNETQRVDLVNDTQQIVSVLNGAEMDRLICERESITGTHTRVVVCVTQRERELAAEMTRADIREIERRHYPVKHSD